MRTSCRARLLAVILLGTLASISAAEAQNIEPPAPPLTAAQIVARMEGKSQEQKQDLKQYRALRHYKVQYRGFSKDIEAAMDVEVDYDAEKGKSFRIVSESGSGILREDVLKRAVNSESDATRESGSTALTDANYQFELEGTDTLDGRTAYVLNVEPRTPSKFLYRGKIWVDAADFAMVKMESQPAKSPSLWIAQTQIHYTGAKMDGFWLPQRVLSVTRVRIGGTAVLTIDYGAYAIGPDASLHTEARLRDVAGSAITSK